MQVHGFGARDRPLALLHPADRLLSTSATAQAQQWAQVAPQGRARRFVGQHEAEHVEHGQQAEQRVLGLKLG